MKVKVKNMCSPSTGKEVANQFIIDTKKGMYFQSYDTIIAFKGGGKIVLDKDNWDYSATTGKYRNMFLGKNIAETRIAIKEKRIILRDLNK